MSEFDDASATDLDKTAKIAPPNAVKVHYQAGIWARHFAEMPLLLKLSADSKFLLTKCPRLPFQICFEYWCRFPSCNTISKHTMQYNFMYFWCNIIFTPYVFALVQALILQQYCSHKKNSTKFWCKNHTLNLLIELHSVLYQHWIYIICCTCSSHIESISIQVGWTFSMIHSRVTIAK